MKLHRKWRKRKGSTEKKDVETLRMSSWMKNGQMAVFVLIYFHCVRLLRVICCCRLLSLVSCRQFMSKCVNMKCHKKYLYKLCMCVCVCMNFWRQKSCFFPICYSSKRGAIKYEYENYATGNKAQNKRCEKKFNCNCFAFHSYTFYVLFSWHNKREQEIVIIIVWVLKQLAENDKRKQQHLYWRLPLKLLH